MILRFALVLIFMAVPACSYSYSIFDYFNDSSKPVIADNFDANKVHKGKLKIPFTIKDEGTGIKSVQVLLDGSDITKQVSFGPGFRNNRYEFNSEDINDGKHCLTVIAEDSSMAKNKTEQKINFRVDNTPPLIRLANGGGLFIQGKTAIIYFISSEPDIQMDGVFQGKDFRVYPYAKGGKNKYRAVLGFSVDDTGNKDYIMEVKAADQAGNESQYHFKVFVKKEEYGKVSFVLRPKKVMLLMPDTIRDDWKRIEDIVVEENAVKYWKGKFAYPSNGYISMRFGIKEYINGYESGRHRGMDFAAPAGAPIKAANAGMIRLAERLPAHGNTVVIEHGQGIFTYYAHMSKILAKVGTKVRSGQVIGLVGATGVASGPHLHFAVSLHNLRVDPRQWLQGVVAD